jgi:transposase-like protein
MSKRKHKAPGKSSRKGIGVMELLEMFPDEESARKWFENLRWPDGERHCPRCGCNNTKTVPNKKPMPYHCGDCRKYFSIKTGSVMEKSNLRLRKWVVAIYLLTTNLKGVSSMKLHRDLGVTQKTAWMMAQKIREGYKGGRENTKLAGTVEVDETFIGGKEKNKHNSKRSHIQGPAGKAVVMGMKAREANKIIAKPVPERTKEELQGFIGSHVSRKAMVYTDDHRSYTGLPYEHESVNHSVGEYVREQAHTNGVESFWAVLKRGYYGTYHRMSEKHLGRYVTEFSGRHNTREMDTIDQMALLAKGMVGKKLSYKKLTMGD